MGVGPCFSRSFNAGVGGSDISDKDPLRRFEVLPYDRQHWATVVLTGERNIKIACLQLEQLGQQICVVDLGAVRRMQIPSGTGVDPDALALLWRETREREVVQVDETVKELPGGSDLHCKPRFSEVYLNLMVF